MRLHRILTAVGLSALVFAPLVAASPALAWGGWGTGNIGVPMPPILGPSPEVAQTPQAQTTPQTAQVPNGEGANGSPIFVAPGVERNGDGQLETSP
jgi:hypothetical protein